MVSKCPLSPDGNYVNKKGFCTFEGRRICIDFGVYCDGRCIVEKNKYEKRQDRLKRESRRWRW